MADSNQQQFLKRLLETFRLEAQEHIAAIAQGLSELERADGAERSRIVEAAFREAHSLKAAARAVNNADIERVCQAVEGVFAAFKRGDAEPSRELLDAMHGANDAMADLLAAGHDGGSGPGRDRLDALLRALDAAFTGDAPQPGAVPPATVPTASPPPAASAADTIRLSAQRLDALLRQTEDLLTVKLAARAQASALAAPLAGLAEWKAELKRVRAAPRSPRPGQDRGLHEFLDRSESRIGALETLLRGIAASAAVGARATAARIDSLQGDIRQILMLEGRGLLADFAKTVRDLARDQAKEVDLIAEGSDLEIDRRVLEEMREPLLHLVRNAIDHGIERPAERVQKGKPRRATLRLALSRRDGDKVEFAVADDGAGVRFELLGLAAVKAGLLPAQRAAQASEAELLPMMFQSGVTTSPMITRVSGRGLGLAIVRERVERLGGTIAVQTRAGAGTTFRAVLPLTLATFHGIEVRAAQQTFIIPTLGVERVLRERRTALRTIENQPALALPAGHVPLVSLAAVLELPQAAGSAADRDVLLAVVLGAAAQRVAFEIDAISGDQEVLVKPLGACLARVRNVAGASVLGDGRAALVLNSHDLLKSARKARVAAPAAVPATQRERRTRILVVEDSITARGLLKNILEAARYEVKTAADGVDAWAALKLDPFDLVVSDVEMPRMNGFDLTARIRADARLADLPVVLVTALESGADRERGAEAGANAYLPKGDFDQQRLLEVLRRLA